MRGISVGRWLLAGVVAAMVLGMSEGLAIRLYLSDLEASLAAHALAADLYSARGIALSLAATLLTGLVLMFFYAAARPRFGPGPRTAIIVATALWLGGYVVTLLAFAVMRLFPRRLLLLWGLIALVELVLAALAGGLVYDERDRT